MSHIIAIQKLIDILLETKVKVSSIENLPEPFKMRAEKTLNILANSSAHTIGQTVPDVEDVNQVEFGPITNFMGREINISKPTINKNVDPEVIDKFKSKLSEIIDSMSESTPRQFYDKYSESEIRGVAKTLGLSVTPTDPQIITSEFIAEIYEAYTRKLKQDELNAEVELAKENMIDEEIEESLSEDEERAVLIHELIEGIKKNQELNEEGENNLREALKKESIEVIKAKIEALSKNQVIPEIGAKQVVEANTKPTRASRK